MVRADASTDVIYYISDKSSAPLQIPSENSGIITDVIETLDFPNVNLIYKRLPFKRMIQTLRDSETPWITYGSAQWNDARRDDLSVNQVITVRHVLLTTPEENYDSLIDIFDKGIVLIRGFNYPGLEELIIQKPDKVFYVENQGSAIRMVQRGRVAAFPEMESRLIYHLNKLAVDKATVSIHDFSNIIPDYDVNLSFSHNFPNELRDSIESQLANLKRTGQLDAILQKYK
jgi:polar amino acid transport system substrate-binding protein